MTSFDVVAYLRRILNTKKIGHAGTLDPAAAGVLPIFAGNATKAIEFFMEKEKVYRAELTLGVSTDTQDGTGTITGKGDVSGLTKESIVSAIMKFKGKYSQTPPMYSALKHNGKKLYEMAREGVSIERTPREITIFDINAIGIDKGILAVSEAQKHDVIRAVFDVHCSKGTYVRTLCADIGESLGCGGHMSFLLRTKAGEFGIESSHTVEELEALNKSNSIMSAVISVEEAFSGFQGINLEEAASKAFLNGLSVKIAKESVSCGDILKVYVPQKGFAALGDVISVTGGSILLKTRKQFI